MPDFSISLSRFFVGITLLLLLHLTQFTNGAQLHHPKPNLRVTAGHRPARPAGNSQEFQGALVRANNLLAQMKSGHQHTSSFRGLGDLARWGWTDRRNADGGDPFQDDPMIRPALEALRISTTRPPNVWRRADQNKDFETAGNLSHLAVSTAFISHLPGVPLRL